MKTTFSLLTLVFISQLTFAGGSRVGNGGGDDNKSTNPQVVKLEKLGIEVEVPPHFTVEGEVRNGINFSGPTVNKIKNFQLRPKRQEIDIMDLSKEFPELAGLNNAQMTKWFTDRKWTQLSKDKNNCPQVQFTQNKNMMTLIVAWKNNKGVSIAADNTEQTRKAATTIIESIKPINHADGECLWK